MVRDMPGRRSTTVKIASLGDPAVCHQSFMDIVLGNITYLYLTSCLCTQSRRSLKDVKRQLPDTGLDYITALYNRLFPDTCDTVAFT